MWQREPCGQLLLVGEVSHEEASAGMREAKVVDVEDAHAEADLGTDGIECGIEGFFRDGKFCEADWYDTALAPDEQSQSLFKGDHFEGAAIGEVVVGDQSLDSGIDEHLKLGELGLEAELGGDGEIFGLFELVGCIQLGLELDGLDRGAAKAQSIDADAVLAAGHSLYLEAAAERVGIVLKRDDVLHRGAGGIEGDDTASEQSWRVCESAGHDLPLTVQSCFLRSRPLVWYRCRRPICRL